MLTTVGQILQEAAKHGLTDKEIRRIAKRQQVTLWRWRKNPNAGFVCDAGMRELLELLEAINHNRKDIP